MRAVSYRRDDVKDGGNRATFARCGGNVDEYYWKLGMQSSYDARDFNPGKIRRRRRDSGAATAVDRIIGGDGCVLVW